MAERIELDIGGKYSAGEVFNQMNKDIKQAGKDMKDMGDGAVKVANGIADAMGGKVNGALKSTMGIVGEMARGGIWGAMAAAATASIGFVADKIKEAKEQAKELIAAFNEMMGGKYKDSFTAISDQLKTTKQEMADATKEADAMLKALNGKVADSAKVQIAQLHVETLQKMTDATSEAAKKAIQAQEAYVATVWKNNATMDQANNELNAANTKRTAALTRYNATEEALEATKEQQRKLETVYSSQLQRRTQLQANIEQWTIESSLSEEKAKENTDHLAWAREQLALLEEQNKEVFAQHAAGLQQINALEAELAVSDTELTNANRAVTVATRNIEVIKNESAASEAEAKFALDNARLAMNAETEATNGLTALKQEQIAKGREKLAQDNEANAVEQQRREEYDAAITKLINDANQREIDWTEWEELMEECYEAGMSAENALTTVKKRYAASLEERAQQEEEAAKEASGKGGKGSSATTVNAISEGVEKGLGNVSVNTSVNTGEVGSGVDKADEVITMGSLQRDVRDEQRKARDKTDAINQSSAAMKAYLQGKMSPEVAQKFAERIKQQGLTLKDLEQMNQKQLKERMMSKSEQQENKKNIEKMEKMLEKMGLK